MREKYLTLVAEIAAFTCMFFADLQATLFAVGFLVMADTFTGMMAAWDEGAKKEKSFWKGWDYVQSRKLGRVIIKLILYPLAIVVAKVAQTYLSPAIPWIDVTAGILAIIEVKSIFENMSKLLGFSLWDRIRKAIWKHKEEGMS